MYLNDIEELENLNPYNTYRTTVLYDVLSAYT